MRAISSCQAAAVCSSIAYRQNPSLLPTRSVSVSTVKPEIDDEVTSVAPLNRRRLILLRHAESALPDRFLRVMLLGQRKPLKLCKSTQRSSHKLRFILCQASILLQQWMVRRLNISKRCMGHNRGWEEAASMFSGSSIELKTCNAALLEANGESWNEAFASAGLGGWKLQGIVRPKSEL